MNWLDILILAVLAWFTITSLTTGLIREAVTLGGLILGVALAGKFYLPLAGQLVFIKNPEAAKIAAFVIILVAVAAGAHLASFFLKQLTSLLMLGWIDHLGGVVIGLAKGVVLVEAILIAFAKFPFLGMGGTISGSALAPIFLKYLPLLLSLLPPEFEPVKRFFQ